MPVTFYDPGGRIAAAARSGGNTGRPAAAAPAPQRARTNTGKGLGQDRITNAIVASRMAGPRNFAAPAAAEEPSGAGGLLGRGLGMVLNNPVVKTVTRPLDVLDVPRRFVWSTINEAVDEFNGGDDGGFSIQDWYDQTNPFHVVTQKGDTSFGAGDVIPEVNTGLGDNWDKWINRGIGLAGDIAADPLTYVDGIGFVADAGTLSSRLGRMTKLAEGTEALEKVGGLTDNVIESAKKVAQSGNWGKAEPALREAAGVSDTAGVRFRVPFTKTVSGPLPGTERIGGKLADVIGGVKGGINASDWGARRIAANVPKEYSNVLPRLLSGSADNEKFMTALEGVPSIAARRKFTRRVAAVASKDKDKMTRQVKEYLRQGNTIDDLIRNTEDLAAPNTPLNDFADRITKIAASMGVEMPEIQGIGYFPHVLSKEFKDLLANGGDDAERFLQQTDIVRDELMRDSGFLQGRKLRGTAERPLTITLPNGRATTLTQGTVEEINQKMADLFPQLKGTALETDPGTAIERYISGVSQDIGNRAAAKERLAAGSKYYGDVGTPALRETLEEGVEGPTQQLEGPVAQRGGPQEVARGENPFADDIYFEKENLAPKSAAATERAAQTADANKRAADRLAQQLAAEETQAQRLRTTVAGDISRTGKEVEGRLNEGVQAVDQQLAQDLEPVNAHLADINTSRADLDLADEMSNSRIGDLDEEISDLTARQREETANRRFNEREFRNVRQEYTAKVNVLKDDLRRVNAKIASLKSRANRLGTRDAAAWRAGREADVATARSELERLQNEAAELRAWGTQSQDRLNYQVADQAISDLNGKIKETQAQLDEIIGVKRAEAEVAHGRPAVAASKPHRGDVAEARKYLETSGNPERYDRHVRVRDAHRAGQKVDPEALAASRKFLRTKAAKTVEKNRALVNSFDEVEQGVSEQLSHIDKGVARQVAADPEVQAAREAAANASLETKRMPALNYKIGAGKSTETTITEEDIRRLFPEPHINPRDVPITEYLQRLRRSYGQENTAWRRGKLVETVKGQQKNIDIANKGLAELFIGAGDQVAHAARQTEFLWKTMPDQMKRQALHEEIVSISDVAQAQMEAFDTTVQNLRVDYKTTLFNKERREAERAANEAALAQHEGQRINLNSKEDTLQKQADFITDEAAAERQKIVDVQGAKGKRSIDPAADIARGKELNPTQKSMNAFDLQTDPATLQPMNQVLNDIKTMAAMDPNRTDEVYGATESLLHKHRQALRDVSGADLTAHQTNQLLREANSGRLLDVVAGQLRDQWTMLPGRGDTVIDTELNRMLSNVIEAGKEPGMFGRTLTSFTNFFKTYATLTPGFHIRNAMSAVFMNTVDGVPFATQMEGLKLWQQWDKAEDPLEWLGKQSKEVQDAFDATFASGAGGRFFESGVAQSTASARSRFKEGVYRNRVTTASQKGGEHVEGSVRLGMALDSTRKGASVSSAYDRVARIHFDYAAVSQMDEQAKKLVPFWTYTSRNLPMQITEMWKKPKVYAWYNSFVRNFEVDPAEFTPEYFDSIGAWNTGEKVAGMPLYFQPDLPQLRVQEDLGRFTKALEGENIGQVLGDVNPFFTAPAEYVFGQDLYTGTQYKDTDYTKAEGFVDKAMLPLMKMLHQTKEGADGTYVQDKGMNFMRAINPLMDRTVRLIPGASGASGDPDRAGEAWARTLLAAPFRTLSPKQQQSAQRSEYFKKLDEAAMQRVLAGGGS